MTPTETVIHDALCGRRNCIGDRCINYGRARSVLRHLDQAEYVILPKATVLAATQLGRELGRESLRAEARKAT